ncbi:hypothetical protein Adt_08043 [Abeliophyllum distichum]|uniref:Late embryogenesis abundant protein LEA-2 subgroup domain-containing protein n=1 Tax=Abeliophyllum distichum TaxID=126358 RepID=A0ABD1VBL9_9LAMI
MRKCRAARHFKGIKVFQHHRKGEKGWKEFDAIEEEGLLDEEGGYKGIPRRCYLLAFIVGFFVLFTFFALILWGAARHFKGIKVFQHHRKGEKGWKEFDAIEEEGLLDEEGGYKGIPRRCYLLAFIVGLFVLFTFFALILWGASRNQKPIVTVKSVTFDKFMIQAGSDNSGVGTEMVSMNSTVKLIFHNTGTFFGVHVSSTTLDLSFSELRVASGTINKFYQSRKGQRQITVILSGSNM